MRDSVFGWSYPPGSMRGSGIYSEDWEGDRWCDTCQADREGMFFRNDWGSVSWTCDTCEAEVSIEAEESEPDYEPDDYEMH